MHADGSRVRQLTRNRVRDETPAWSSDGTRIAYVHERQADLLELWTMRADGRGARRLVRASRGVNEQAYSPDWAPDGRTLVFSSNRPGDGNPELYRVRADGTGLTRLTRTAGTETLGDDGFPPLARRRDGRVPPTAPGRNVELWTMRANGSGQRRLLVRPATDDLAPRWSPGRLPARVRRPLGHRPGAAPRILVMRADGTGVDAIQAGAEVDWR